MEYIEREAAIAAAFSATSLGNSAFRDVYDTVSRLRLIPAADVRPVVLCRDCKYYYKDADGYEMCENSEGYDHVREDGFCAWAKKREES